MIVGLGAVLQCSFELKRRKEYAITAAAAAAIMIITIIIIIIIAGFSSITKLRATQL